MSRNATRVRLNHFCPPDENESVLHPRIQSPNYGAVSALKPRGFGYMTVELNL